jgi:RecA-family ATPase
MTDGAIIREVFTPSPPAGAANDAGTLPTIDAGRWEGKLPPERRWIVSGWLEAGTLHLFGGKGGDGKSLLLQQLGTTVAAGAPCLPGLVPVRAGPVLIVNCEDDEAELHRRQANIMAALAVPWAGIAGRLHLAALAGAESARLHLGRFDDKLFRPGPPLEAIERKAAEIGAIAIFLDNRAQLYPGDLNDNAQVTSFCNSLTGLAKRTGAAVVLATHPAKGEGSEFAGAAAWENACRSRWWLEREAEGSDVRRLTRGKANHAAAGDAIAFQWRAGAFRALVEGGATLSPREQSAGAAFIACLRECHRQQRNVTAAPGASFAPTVFAAMPPARGFTRGEMHAAMERLLGDGRLIPRAKMPWLSSCRHAVWGLGEAPQ